MYLNNEEVIEDNQLTSSLYTRIGSIWGEDVYVCLMGSRNTSTSYEGNYTTSKDGTWIWVALTITRYQGIRTYTIHTCHWDVEKIIKSVPIVYSYV